MKRISTLTLTVILLLSLQSSVALGQVTTQTLTWNKIEATLKLPKKFSVKLEIQDRSFFHPLAQHQFLVRGSGFYSLNHGWAFYIGYTYFLQSPHDPNSESNLVAPEHRPMFGFTQKQKYGRITLSHRYQLEERFQHNTAGSELAPGYKFVARLRYRLGLSILLFDKDKSSSKGALKLNISDELHMQVGKPVKGQPYDQNRVHASLEYNITDNLAVFTGYTNWFQQRSNNQGFYNRHIIDSGISLKFDLSKKKTTQ